MRLYDPLHHQRFQRQMPGNFDPRWVMVKRPFVKAGGELTTAQLSPSFDPLMRYYEAPIHLKANGGIFLLDDFGRQDSSPRALLNRLIVITSRSSGGSGAASRGTSSTSSTRWRTSWAAPPGSSRT